MKNLEEENEQDENCVILAICITRGTIFRDHGAVRYNSILDIFQFDQMNAIDVLTLVIPHLYIFYEVMKCGKTI